MPQENVFRFSLIVSVIIHAFFLYKLPHLNTSSLNKSLQEIEVTYYKLQMLKLKTEDSRVAFKKPQEEKVTLLKKENPPSPLLKEAESFFKKNQSVQKNPMSVKQFSSLKRISVPEVKSDNKIKNPKYNNYYQVIREKVRRYAYGNYTRYETGEVYLVFVVLRDGSLKDVRLIEEKTKANSYLKEIALKSIKDASPYPSFPEGLSYPELSFNVIISFEISG
ncbi:MAG: hypothetical protein Q8O13_02095 [Candidatus Omnitrophota bacterium]|nr:hypothetical protein [Candidatus Omnitrophota bacterium]